MRYSPRISPSSLVIDEFDVTHAERASTSTTACTVPLLADVRQSRGMAGAGDPAGGQRDPVPAPLGRPLLAAGRGDRAMRCVTYPAGLNVQIWGTGGMSHQLQGERAGLINPAFDNALPRRPPTANPDTPAQDHPPRVPARGRHRRHRADHVADHARGTWAARVRGAQPLLPRPGLEHRGQAYRAAPARLGLATSSIRMQLALPATR